MSRELFKSMIYKNGKVFTRQCSSNVYPKHYYSEENSPLTRFYNEVGQEKFEKGFIDGILQGYIVVLGNSSGVLNRLNSIANIIWEDKEFKKIYNKLDEAFNDAICAKDEKEKEITKNRYDSMRGDIYKIISSFYDKYNNKLLEKQNERGR